MKEWYKKLNKLVNKYNEDRSGFYSFDFELKEDTNEIFILRGQLKLENKYIHKIDERLYYRNDDWCFGYIRYMSGYEELENYLIKIIDFDKQLNDFDNNNYWKINENILIDELREKKIRRVCMI